MAHLGVPHEITLVFSNPLNVSVQIGDVAYYCNTVNVGVHPSAGQSDIIEIGVIINIAPWNGTIASITCETELLSSQLPSIGSFIMFSKDNKANLSSLIGYYVEVKLVNDSTSEAELFSVGCGFTESSK